ncbi:hypothetical protein [Puia sp.]|jgi:hypothetical protein|uniref:hypothetical protein n=1 Tax=Puia sp. TaxID=2045100 RepID=UPI002F3EF661
MDIEFVRENYQRMPDAELVRVATEDSAGLTPEAQEIVKEEIQKRGLNKAIISGVEAQNKSYTTKEIDHYCELVRTLDCPMCGSAESPLNATITSEVMSFIILTQRTNKVKVACPGCLDKANNRALTKTAVLGWWGVPWGIIRSVQAITRNISSKRTNRAEGPNDTLRSYVLSRIGRLETYKGSTEKLQEIISSE